MKLNVSILGETKKKIHIFDISSYSLEISRNIKVTSLKLICK